MSDSARLTKYQKIKKDQNMYMYKSNRNEERVFPTDFADSQKAKPNVEGA